MLKRIIILPVLLSSIFAAAQDPVQFKLIAANNSVIKINAFANAGWRVYAAASPEDGITGLELKPENGNVSIIGEPVYIFPAHYIKDPLFEHHLLKVYDNSFSFSQNLSFHGEVLDTLRLEIKGFAASDTSFLPLSQTILIPMGGSAAASVNLTLNSINLSRPVAACGITQPPAAAGYWTVFLLGLAGGLLALLTPCVFPMIPVTVSFFTGLGQSRRQGIKNGLVYGLCILAIYLLASIPFHLAGNISPQIFNTIATSAGVNIFFFVIFICFALSFFGLFEIRLPSTVANSSGSRGGIFFMALTLAIVSFSCTGPILGSLLVGSLDGGAWQLTAGMAGFGLALALPFTLFAIFPNLLKALPKSGGWMETAKKILAFVELALALKFLSNADLVQHWGILKREVFVGIWLLIALGLAAYLVGLFEKEFKLIPKWRFSLAAIALLFAGYLVPGLTNTKYNALSALSGFPPPKFYSIYNSTDNTAIVNDFDKALTLAKAQHKPLLIDFTGWACVNCRKMEEQVWSRPEITAIIKDKYILVSLYVDDREKLPETIRFKERQLKTVGDKWAAFEQENFSQVSQPLYVLLSPEGELLNNPVGYTPQAEDYKRWLECGWSAMTK